MQIPKNLPYYLIIAGLLFCFKWTFRLIWVDDLYFLLKPTSKIVETFSHSESIYLNNKGFYFESLNIIIDKSCSGFNFWMISFIAFSYLGIKYALTARWKTFNIFITLVITYFFTILVNASRILVSLYLQNFATSILPKHQHLIHESIGVTTNLTFLLLCYIIIEKILIKFYQNEKPAQS